MLSDCRRREISVFCLNLAENYLDLSWSQVRMHLKFNGIQKL
jgi:hypothetical protein